MVELSKLEKPDAENFKGKRKLYCLPNVYPIPGSDEKYKNLISKFWDEAEIQISKLELMTPVTYVFCEMVYQNENALDVLSKIDSYLFDMVKKHIDKGAKLVPIEEENVFSEYVDWANCLKVVTTEKVFTKVMEFFSEIANKRFHLITEIIDKNLGSSEAGLLIIKDEDRRKINFPPDVEIFLITPPAYDDILKFIRDLFRNVE
jgi:hypothetical protein